MNRWDVRLVATSVTMDVSTIIRFPLWNLPTRAKNKHERLLFPYLLFVYNPGGILIDVYLLSGRGQTVLCDKMDTASHPNTLKYETIYWGYVATT